LSKPEPYIGCNALEGEEEEEEEEEEKRGRILRLFLIPYRRFGTTYGSL